MSAIESMRLVSFSVMLLCILVFGLFSGVGLTLWLQKHVEKKEGSLVNFIGGIKK